MSCFSSPSLFLDLCQQNFQLSILVSLPRLVKIWLPFPSSCISFSNICFLKTFTFFSFDSKFQQIFLLFLHRCFEFRISGSRNSINEDLDLTVVTSGSIYGRRNQANVNACASDIGTTSIGTDGLLTVTQNGNYYNSRKDKGRTCSISCSYELSADINNNRTRNGNSYSKNSIPTVHISSDDDDNEKRSLKSLKNGCENVWKIQKNPENQQQWKIPDKNPVSFLTWLMWKKEVSLLLNKNDTKLDQWTSEFFLIFMIYFWLLFFFFAVFSIVLIVIKADYLLPYQFQLIYFILSLSHRLLFPLFYIIFFCCSFFRLLFLFYFPLSSSSSSCKAFFSFKYR